LETINSEGVQTHLNRFCNQNVYVHLETTTGSYASLEGENRHSVVAYIRNSMISFSRGIIRGGGPFCIGLKLDNGWVYAEGLTDWEVRNEGEQLLLAGHNQEGNLQIALQLSFHPF
jgi:hypothetical protein